MPSGGFIINDTQPTGIDSSWDATKIVLLHEDTDRDANSLHGAVPSQFEVDHIDVILDETTITVTTCQVVLYWDSAGDDIAFGPSDAITLVAGMTDTSLRMASLSVGQRVRPPATQTTAGKMYGQVITDAGEATLKTLRVHWHDTRDGE